MPLAADYPFLDVLWTMIIFFAWVVWIWMMVIILTDVFRRDDIGGWHKAAWCVFLIVLPFLGVFCYLIAQHQGMADRRARDIDAQQKAFDARVRQAAGGTDGGGAASEIAKAKTLLDQGAISQSEYEQLKRAALT
jgi:hypothetical protein